MKIRFVAALLCAAYLSPAAAEIIPGYYSAPGMDANRDYLNQHFSEYIDPFTGKLQLHYVDLVLPGNGGLDLAVRRSYTNIEYTQRETGDATLLGTRTPWGMGWTMHFGRVMRTTSSACTRGSLIAMTDNPVLELPDGSHEILFDAWTVNPSGPQYLTKGRWKADCDPAGSAGLIVTSPEGTRYDMTIRELKQMGTYTEYSWYVSRITDRNGNTIDFTYTRNPVNYLLLTSISTSDGRSITFTYADETTPDARLTSVSTSGRTWTYDYIQVPGLQYRYFLTQVNRPNGGRWAYQYNGNLGTTTAGSYSLNRLTYPTNGTISYTYKFTKFDLADATNDAVTVATKVADGGTWSFAYAPGTSYDVTTVTTPIGTLSYRHFGYSAATNGTVWKIGLPLQKTTGTIQTETYAWGEQVISNENYGGAGIFALKQDIGSRTPIMTNKTITRDGTAYSTTYSLFDSYGNPGRKVESGNASRTTDFTYYIDTVKWIVKQLKNETISGVGTISRTFNSNGNLTNETRYGVSTDYTYLASGDLNTIRNARLNTRTYSSYYRGVPRTESRPEAVSITRTVDNAGNILSETNGEGHRTTYTYDGIDRLTGIGFPTGSPVTINWGTTSRTVTRGGYTESVTFDGYARPVSITRGGITTTATYNRLGQKTFESYPGSTSGTTFVWDMLDRMTRATHPDASRQDYSYLSGNRATVTNERNHATTYTYRSFGDPADRALMGITAPVSAASVTMTRNLLDLLTGVTQNGKTRTYGYNAAFFLTSVVNPETGTTVLGRDAVGNMTSRRVGTSGTVSFAYDGLDRLSSITYPSGTPNVTQTWSKTGKLKTVSSSSASRVYTYDANDNLTGETLTVGTSTYPVSYGINSLDHVASITYPSNVVVTYSPDTLGRPTSVAPYVTSASYHPSGQVSGMTYANGVTSAVSFNSRQWPTTQTAAKGSLLVNLTYGYDVGGNPTSITDAINASGNRTLGYDAIDRLTSASGSWGAGSMAYDGMGNITSKALGSQVINYTYDAVNGRLTSTSGAATHAFTYDAYGNVIGNGLYTFTYNDASQLTAVPSLGGVSYRYDGSGMRVLSTANGVSQHYFYNQAGLLLFKTEVGGNRATEYFYLGSRLVASRDYGPGVTSPPPPTGTLQLSGSSYSVAENGGNLTVTVTRANGTGGAASVNYATSNGTAAAGSDYTTRSGTLNWAAGDGASKTFVVPILDDTSVEGNETFTVTLSGAVGATLGSPSAATVTITDWESGTLSLSPSAYSVTEAATTVTVTVTRTGGNGGAVSVSYATSNGTAAAGTDYTTASGTLSWASGDGASKTFAVAILNDVIAEPAETINLTLSTPTGGATLGTTTGTITINDNPPGTVQFLTPPTSVAENGGSLAFTVNRTGGSEGPASVLCSAVNGTATVGNDFTNPNATLTWAAGDSANKTCAVPILNDSTTESTETFTANLSNATGGTLGTPSAATVSIVDDDTIAPSVPANLRTTPSGVVQGSNFTVRWDASTGNPANYQLQESTDDGSTWPSTYTINAPTLFRSFTKPNGDATYTYRIRACNASGQCSGYSNTVWVTTILMCGSVPC